MNIKKKRILFSIVFACTLSTTILSIFKFGALNKSAAAIYTNVDTMDTESSLPKVMYKGESMYVAEASFYDYYSDVQIGEGDKPLPITDGVDYNRHTMNKFNLKLSELMNYGDPDKCPAKWPLYQGRQGRNFSDCTLYSFNNNSPNEKNNYWLGANNSQIGAYATQGLVDSKLRIDDLGVSHLTQSNPANGKSADSPLFDKEFLTKNKFDGSKLSLGSVKEGVAFPFRKVEENGIMYYEYDSLKDTVRFNSKDQLDYYGPADTSERTLDPYGNGGFFPFNQKEDSKSNKLNYAYGVKIEVPFIMTVDGQINGQDMVYSFTGDDDVWVFIDGYLALDMGGGHPKTSGFINFAKQVSEVSGVKNNKVAFATRMMTGYGTNPVYNAGLGFNGEPAVYTNKQTEFSDELKESLSDTTKVHTLTLYYMERGMDVANMKMKFNLIEPTKMTVSQKIGNVAVNETFKSELDKVTNKETFLYDVENRTTPKYNMIDLQNGKRTLFLNEFQERDTVLVQQKGLADGSRKITDLYGTLWTLTDCVSQIGKGAGAVVNDPRVGNNTIIMQNGDGKDVPVLDVAYVNNPILKYTL